MNTKVLIGAAAALFVLASPALAQTTSSSCSGFAPPPSFPDGATASRSAVERANREYDAWAQARLARLQSCKGEIEVLQAQLRPLIEVYEPAKAELDAVVASWSAEVAEFNARGSGTSDSNRRGGTITRPDSQR